MKLSGNRRQFIGSGLAAMAACAVGSRGWAQGGRMALPLGICSYSFRAFPRAQMIGFLKQLQITTVNLKDVKDHLPSTSVAEEQAALAEYAAAGIRPTAVGTINFTKDEDADIREKFEYAKRAGVQVIVAGQAAPTTLPRLEKFVKEYDMRLAIHNHGPEDKMWQSPLNVLESVKGMDPRMGCCIDVGHTMRAGTDVVEAIKAVGPRLFDVHMKDLAQKNVKESQVAVGEGLMPVKGIFAALVAIGYKGNVDLEYEIHADDPMPGVTASFADMRKVLAEMQG